MESIKLTVTKFLNVRVGAPTTAAPSYAYLSPGSIIEVEEKPVKGYNYDNNDVWYKGLDGSFYWSGGLATTPGTPPPILKIDYPALLQSIPSQIRMTKGKGVTIAFLDSGCGNTIPGLSEKIIGQFNAVDNTADASDLSHNSHGTMIASIIAATGDVTGIASQANLIPVRSFTSSSVKNSNMLKGLKWLEQQRPDIINISAEFSPKGFEQEFKEIFKRLSQTVIIVAAAGDNLGLFQETINYPAVDQACVSVGSLSRAIFLDKSYQGLNQKIDFLVPDFRFRGFSTSANVISEVGSSYATALVSGVAALYLSAFKSDDQDVTPTDVINAIKNDIGVMDQHVSDTNLKIYKR